MAISRKKVIFALFLTGLAWQAVSQAPETSRTAAPIDPQKEAVLTAPVNAKSKVVTGSRLNVRAAPALNATILTTLPRGSKVAVVKTQNGWSQIHLAKSQTQSAWVASRFLADTLPPRAKPVAQPRPATPKRTIARPTNTETAQARKILIRRSIAAYPGSCPCPYNLDRAGRRCGKRSAWSRPGGHSPLCYESDITAPILATYFARQRGATH